MAKDKSKDEVKADIIDQEIADTTVEEVKAIDPVAKEKIEKVEKAETKATAKTTKKKTTKKEEKNDGATQKSDTAAVQANQEPAEEVETVKEAVKTAKAGKRSEKALKETEEKQAKEDRKAAQSAEAAQEEKSAPKQKQRTAVDRLKTRGKNYRKAYELVDKDKEYGLKEALDLAVKINAVKFDAAVELHVNLGVDPKHADQNVRGTLVLPNGTGKTLRVAVLAEADDAAKAKKAGADIAGSDDVLAALEKGTIDFDTLISVPTLMGKLGKYARLLGPKGLMPNPKSGTVTTDVAKAVKEAKAGKLEYRVDSTGIVHCAIGRVSFGADKLLPNVQAVLSGIRAAKPASVKGNYLKAIHLTTSMGPGIKVALNEAV